MKRAIAVRVSPSMAVALTALFVALGGTGYAALSLPRNSVGTKQLRTGAVTAKKIKNGAVTAKKLNLSGVTVPNALHAGSADTATSAGHAGSADSATSAGHAGSADSAINAANLGGTPAARFQTFGSTLPSGATETGIWGVGGGGGGSPNVDVGTIEFNPQLAAGLDGSHVIFVADPLTGVTHCSGFGHADPGYLCVYLIANENVNSPPSIEDGSTTGAAKEGAVISFGTCCAGPSLAFGRWAVTAP